MIGMIRCWWAGKHKRGTPLEGLKGTLGKRYFACPRCGRVTSYKTKGDSHAKTRALPVD